MVTSDSLSSVVFVALGANLDRPEIQLQSAVDAFGECRDIELGAISSLYSTNPMGPADQPGYINAVCSLKTRLQPIPLLDLLQSIEQSQGRKKEGQRWGPRTLDLDMLLYGDETIEHERLTVPHPGIVLRSFVLMPLLEIAPNLHIPGLGAAASYRETVELFGIAKLEARLES